MTTWNPFVQCAGKACDNCPDPMPPAFVLAGDFANGLCAECEGFDGLLLLNTDQPCSYVDNHPTGICNTSVNLDFSADPPDVQLIIGRGVRGETYYKYDSGSCNQTHTLIRAEPGLGLPDCEWPDSVTVSPSS
jgi:hypothetical protein